MAFCQICLQVSTRSTVCYTYILFFIAVIDGPFFWDLGFGYLIGRAPKLGHRSDGLWCVNNLPKVVT